MPVTQPKDPFKNYRFVVEIDGIVQAAFRKVIMPEAWAEVLEYREGSDPFPYSRKIIGRVQFGNLLLKKGVTDSMEIFNWWNTAIEGSAQGRNIAVILLNDKREPVCRWEIEGALPVRYKPGVMDAEGSAVLIETLEVACQSYRRVM